MDTTTFALLLAIVAGGYIASAQYKFQGQFDKFCNLSDVKKNKTLICVEETYLNASQLLHPRKVLGDMCNITKANPINVPLFLENLVPRFLQKNVTAVFRALKGCFQKKAKKGSKHC
uniref:Putative secreted protein n=1 Tax=Amblyomma americanum TaxID=6943 RepID=A0A0C9SD96_AMBAM